MINEEQINCSLKVYGVANNSYGRYSSVMEPAAGRAFRSGLETRRL